MAFVKAEVVRYGSECDPVTGDQIAIVISGRITDDQYGDWFGIFRIEGAALANLPAATTGLPDDPRGLAIMGLCAEFVKQKHAEWMAAIAAQPTFQTAPEELVALMPPITALPDDPAEPPADPAP